MSVDIRATVTCTLGKLISGNISDDYIQGSGLIRTKGYCELSGLLSPAIGTTVNFSYTKNGITRRIPRQLLVLSSFADPFRRTTKVELGCRLTYLQDLKEPVKWEWYDDDKNNDRPASDSKIVTIPINASSVMDKCLTELGITASQNPLTNKFSIAEFDFSSGYVDVLSNLLVSESYFGYMNDQGVLEVLSLDQEGGTGPVLSSSNVIDIGSIGVGQLPGEAVTVSYSTLKLKLPDGSELDPNSLVPEWEAGNSTSLTSVLISYDTPNGPAYTEFPNLITTGTVTTYREIATKDGVKNVVSLRLTTEYCNACAVLGNLASGLLSQGLPFNNSRLMTLTSEVYQYDEDGNETAVITIRQGSMAHALGESPLPMVFSGSDFVIPSYSDSYVLSRVERRTMRNGDNVMTVTNTYGSWLRTIAGQQAVAEARDYFRSSSDVLPFIGAAINGQSLLSSVVDTSSTKYRGQTGPRTADQINQATAAESGDPDNGYRTESSAELELAIGSAEAQRRIEFSMPFAPDDTFERVGEKFIARASDAPEKARRFGIVQNRLLLGNRSGMNIQAAPESIPAKPFTPFFVVGNGFAALYRTNGTSWTMDSSGVVASTDGLYWGISGKAS